MDKVTKICKLSDNSNSVELMPTLVNKNRDCRRDRYPCFCNQTIACLNLNSHSIGARLRRYPGHASQVSRSEPAALIVSYRSETSRSVDRVAIPPTAWLIMQKSNLYPYEIPRPSTKVIQRPVICCDVPV